MSVKGKLPVDFLVSLSSNIASNAFFNAIATILNAYGDVKTFIVTLLTNLGVFMFVKPVVVKTIAITVFSVILSLILVVIANKWFLRNGDKLKLFKDYKLALDITKDKNLSIRNDIINGIKHNDINPLIDNLHEFRYKKYRGLTSANVHLKKSDFCFMQFGFILKDQEGKVAVFRRLGSEVGYDAKLTDKNSIIRAFSPTHFQDKKYFYDTILDRIGMIDKPSSIISVSPYALAYNEIADPNEPIIGYFFIIYEVVVKEHPILKVKHGTYKKKGKHGDVIECFVDPIPVALEPYEYKRNLDKLLVRNINNLNSLKTMDKGDIYEGDCILVPMVCDVMHISKRSRHKG